MVGATAGMKVPMIDRLYTALGSISINFYCEGWTNRPRIGCVSPGYLLYNWENFRPIE